MDLKDRFLYPVIGPSLGAAYGWLAVAGYQKQMGNIVKGIARSRGSAQGYMGNSSYLWSRIPMTFFLPRVLFMPRNASGKWTLPAGLSSAVYQRSSEKLGLPVDRRDADNGSV